MVRGWLGRSKKLLDTDPEIDKFRTIWQEEHIREKDLAVLAGLSPSTVHNLFDGQTKRPQHMTYSKLADAMGHEYTLKRVLKPVYEKEIPIALAEYKAYQKKLAKARQPKKKRKK